MPSFAALKDKSASGEGLEELRSKARYNLGTHKSSRLKRAGISETTSLLQDDVSKMHAAELALEFEARARKIGKDAQERFRFLTILHSVEDIVLEDVSASVHEMEKAYYLALNKLGLWSRGAIELEVVNLTILKKISRIKEGEARKLNVLSALTAKKSLEEALLRSSNDDTKVLVHLHSVVDLGPAPDETESDLRELLAQNPLWTRTQYQLEVKGLFKNRPISENLLKIAAYVTKGGNENLRYNAGFGRDLAEDLEAKIWKAGFLGRADKGAETVTDERGLTIGEVQKLDELYLWLMGRKKVGRGYIL